MHSIIAKLPPVSEPGFKTAEEAINNSKRIDDVRQLEMGYRSPVGREIVSGSWNDITLTLLLSGAQELLLWTTGSQVKWSVGLQPGELAVPTPSLLRFPLTIRLQNTQFVWDGKELMTQMIGRTITRLYAGSRDVFLYLSEMPILHFFTLVEVTSGNPFLVWNESE